MIFERLASAIRNDVVGGLKGFHTNMSLSIELLIDDIVDERLLIIKEFSLKGLVPVRDLVNSINCIDVDCKDIEKCSCHTKFTGTPQAHFEIPLLLTEYGINSIQYIGTTDKQTPFVFYTSPLQIKYRLYRKRGKDKPYVWIDTTPNENGMYDCFLFNAPLLKQVSISAIFKDLRQLEQYECCNEVSNDNFNFINNEIKKRLTEKKIRYYRSLAAQDIPNNQTYTAG